MSEEKGEGIETEPRRFAEAGLLVMGLLGGFVFTVLVLILGSARNLDMDAFYTRAVFGITASQAWYFIMVVGLSAFSFISLIICVTMSIVYSATDRNLVVHTARFVERWTMLAVGGFGGILSWIVLPYSQYGSATVFVVNSLIVYLYLTRVAHKDEALRRKALKTMSKNTKKSTA